MADVEIKTLLDIQVSKRKSGDIVSQEVLEYARYEKDKMKNRDN